MSSPGQLQFRFDESWSCKIGCDFHQVQSQTICRRSRGWQWYQWGGGSWAGRECSWQQWSQSGSWTKIYSEGFNLWLLEFGWNLKLNNMKTWYLYIKPWLSASCYNDPLMNSQIVRNMMKWYIYFVPEERSKYRIMGRIFLEHIGGSRLFTCNSCDTVLTNK